MSESIARPDAAPEIRRRLAFTRKQIVGLPLLVAVPILSLFGVFGERLSDVHAESPSVTMTVRYPARLRYRQVQPLDIVVRNTSHQLIDTIEVSLDTAYMSRFSDVRIEPAPHRAFVVAVTDVQPGESRLVAAELAADRYGRHQGRIRAATRIDSATASVRTVVFP